MKLIMSAIERKLGSRIRQCYTGIDLIAKPGSEKKFIDQFALPANREKLSCVVAANLLTLAIGDKKISVELKPAEQIWLGPLLADNRINREDMATINVAGYGGLTLKVRFPDMVTKAKGSRGS